MRAELALLSKPPFEAAFLLGGAMVSGVIRISGVGDVQAALSALGADVQSRVMRNALRAAGEVMRDAEAAAAPVRVLLPSGTALPPGALKADVTLTVTARFGRLMAIVSPGKLTRRVASWVEYGHRLVKGGKNSSRYDKRTGRFKGFFGRGKQVGTVDAHPYIRPAFEASLGACLAAFGESLRAGLTRSRRAVARKAA